MSLTKLYIFFTASHLPWPQQSRMDVRGCTLFTFLTIRDRVVSNLGQSPVWYSSRKTHKRLLTIWNLFRCERVVVCPVITLLIVQKKFLSSHWPSNQARVDTFGIIDCANRPVPAASPSTCQYWSISRLANILKSLIRWWFSRHHLLSHFPNLQRMMESCAQWDPTVYSFVGYRIIQYKISHF